MKRRSQSGLVATRAWLVPQFGHDLAKALIRTPPNELLCCAYELRRSHQIRCEYDVATGHVPGRCFPQPHTVGVWAGRWALNLDAPPSLVKTLTNRVPEPHSHTRPLRSHRAGPLTVSPTIQLHGRWKKIGGEVWLASLKRLFADLSWEKNIIDW